MLHSFFFSLVENVSIGTTLQLALKINVRGVPLMKLYIQSHCCHHWSFLLLPYCITVFPLHFWSTCGPRRRKPTEASCFWLYIERLVIAYCSIIVNEGMNRMIDSITLRYVLVAAVLRPLRIAPNQSSFQQDDYGIRNEPHDSITLRYVIVAVLQPLHCAESSSNKTTEWNQ